MIPANETFKGTWPFEPRFSTAAGFRMHYVDEGRGETILCLHGEPTWGYLYRKFIGPLSRDYRVVVPDHMGFGKSETPQDRDYTLRTHVENLEALVLELDLRDITLVVQDWGGPIGGCLAADHPERIKRVFHMNTIFYPFAQFTTEMGEQLTSSRWFTWVKRAMADGSLEAVLGSLGVTIVAVMKHLMGFERGEVIDETWERAYGGAFADRASCIGGIAFPLDVVTAKFVYREPPRLDAYDVLRTKPAMLALGMQDRAIPAAITRAGFLGVFGERPIIELERAGHFLQEDEPELLVALLRQFMQSS